MKKGMIFLGAILLASSILTSCGNSIESDAKKVAEIQCKAQKLMEKAATGDMTTLAESQSIAAEAISLQKEMEGKYTSEEDQQKFAEALLKEVGNCK
jgi:hypothetical protein